MLIEDLDFLVELELLRATAVFALFENVRDIGDDGAGRDFLDLEVVIFAIEVCCWVKLNKTPYTFYTISRHARDEFINQDLQWWRTLNTAVLQISRSIPSRINISKNALQKTKTKGSVASKPQDY